MPFVRSIDNARPPALPSTASAFTTALIQEAAASGGPWTTLSTLALATGTPTPAGSGSVSPTGLDASAAAPQDRDLSTNQAALATGWYRVVWKDAAGSSYEGDAVYFPSSGTAYSTPGDVREELGLTSTQLTDAAAAKLIAAAEILIDEALGARPVDEDTGRKVDPAAVEAWRWAKLQRASTLLAAEIHRRPEIRRGQRWRSVSGPQFSFSGPAGSELPDEVEALLNQSGLRRLTTAIGDRALRPPWDDFAYNRD